MNFSKKFNINVEAEVYYNPNKPEICNGGKDWGDSCSYLSEHSSFCDLFRKNLIEQAVGFRKSFKCEECLLNTGQLK